MSILADASTRVLVQGITGSLGQSETQKMLTYGTQVVAGVTPGRGGQEVQGVPVYNTVAEAVRHHRVDVAMNYVPARLVRDAAMECIDARIPLLTIAAELMPVHDAAQVLTAARRYGTRVLGPNTLGVASPGKALLGGIGGERAHEVLLPGSVGVISTSGGMGVEICWTLTRAGIGQSTYVATGGEAMVGTSFRELLVLFAADAETRAVVMFTEPGSRYDEDAADFIRQSGFTKPVFAFVTGRFTEDLPGVQFGHSRTIVEGRKGAPSEKVRAFAAAGVRVLQRMSELPGHLEAVL